VVQSDECKTELAQIVVAMITSNMSRAGCASRVSVLGAKAWNAGLLMDSVITADNLATIRDAEIERAIGNFPDLGEVDEALRYALAL